MITSVNKEGVGHGIDIDPFTLVLHLKAINAILYKEGQEAMIRMRWHSQGKLWLWTWRIKVCNEDLQA